MDLVFLLKSWRGWGSSGDGSAMRCQKERLQYLDMADLWTWILFGFRFSYLEELHLTTYTILYASHVSFSSA